MTIYQSLREAGFKESLESPVVVSGLTGIVERLQAGRIPFAVLPGYLVPEARSESYPEDAFKDNYVVFHKTSQ